jgi:nucleoside-diphosphate-sugar epimerase
MRVGIIGFKGFVGSAFFKVFSEDKGCKITGIDKENYERFLGSDFDILINADGNSNKRLADSDPIIDFNMNVIDTLKFISDFEYKHFIHISTVYVYSDRSTESATREGTCIELERLTNYGMSKYISELIVKKYCKSWMILRLAGMVGPNMKKGPAFDILNLKKLFISSKSRLNFLSTTDVANISKQLVAKKRWNEIYNVVAKESVELSEFARLAQIKLSSEGKEKQIYNISSKKIEKEFKMPKSADVVSKFIYNWEKDSAE